MRKLIRSVAAAVFSSGEAKRFGRDLRTKPELTAARQGYWDRLLIGPVLGRALRAPRIISNFQGLYGHKNAAEEAAEQENLLSTVDEIA